MRSKRLPKETWARILDAYMGGATARELALKHGVAVQSIYARMNGKGKNARPRTLSFAVRPDTSLLPRERDRAGVFPKLFENGDLLGELQARAGATSTRLARKDVLDVCVSAGSVHGASLLQRGRFGQI